MEKTTKVQTGKKGGIRGFLFKALPVVGILAGLLAMFYPFIANYIYENQVYSYVTTYEQEMEEMDRSQYEELIKAATEYNETLAGLRVELSFPYNEQYQTLYDMYKDLPWGSSDGILCMVDIPKIKVYLPAYPGTEGGVLEKGVGHLEGTSVPIGGPSTHAILSAHTGLNSKKMFTDLTEMEEGDLFFVHIMGDTLAYRVCDINIVLPEDTSLYAIQNGRDLVTLVTCTPYGVNTHRLLVTGERTDYTPEVQEEAEKEVSDGETVMIQVWRKAIIIAVAMIIIVVILAKSVQAVLDRRKKKQR